MSGRKNFLAPYHAITAGDMSGNITQLTPTNIQFMDNVAIQLNFTGTPTGSFSIQGSLDYNPVTGAGNWVALTLTPSPGASGAAASILIDMNQLSFPWIRVVYTASSGSGILDAWISGKMV